MLLQPGDVPLPPSHIPLEKLPYAFYNDDFKIAKLENERPYTNFSVAKALLLNDCVRLVPQEGVFIVSPLSADGNKIKNLVTLFPCEQCTCKAKNNCHHIVACKMSIRMEEKKQKNAKLSTIMRKERGYKAGRKKAPKNLTVVECAEDSEKGSSLTVLEKNTVLIPTVLKEGDIVRNRFCSIVPDTTNRESTYMDSFLENAVSSTPKKNEIPDISKDSMDEEPNTFILRFKKNKQFTLFGRHIYPGNLDCLSARYSLDTDNKFFNDTILDIYINILIYEIPNLNNVKIFCAENILYQFDQDERYLFGMQYFLQYGIPEHDIILFPVTRHRHCSLFILNRKAKQIIHLDSAGYSLPLEPLEVILTLFKAYEVFKGYETTQFTIFKANDIPKQSNSFDCGLFVCLYAQALTTKTDPFSNNAYKDNYWALRQKIKEKIIFYMEYPVPGKPDYQFFEHVFMKDQVTVQPK